MRAAANLETTLRRVLEREEYWATHPALCWGESTGFVAIDQITGGIHPGVTLLGARTSHGKTALSMQIATNITRRILEEWLAAGATAETPLPGQVLVFSPEMTAEQLMFRYATQRSGVPIDKIRHGEASPEERERWRLGAQELTLFAPFLSLYTADADLSFESMVDTMETAVRKGPRVRLVVIDYIQRLDVANLNAGSEYQMLRYMCHRLKDVATRHDVPFLVAAQLNRVIERDNRMGSVVERPPQVSDLLGGSHLEMSADMVWLLWRPPDKESARRGLDHAEHAKLGVEKFRDGPVGDAELLYYPHLALFADPPYLRDGGDR